MYNIMICDDDRVYAEYLASLLSKYQDERNVLNIDICESGEEIMSMLKDNTQYDWLIVDLKFGTMDGYEVAEEYRRVSPNGLLYFCSGICSPTVRSFYTSPYRFIDKGMEVEEIRKHMDDGIEYLKRSNKKTYLLGHIRTNKYKILSKNVMFIENGKRGSILHIDRDAYQYCYTEDMLIEEKLEDLYELLYGDFEYISKRCLVNLKYVKMLEKNVVTLENGIQLTSSRPLLKEFRRRFVEYVEEYLI